MHSVVVSACGSFRTLAAKHQVYVSAFCNSIQLQVMSGLSATQEWHVANDEEFAAGNASDSVVVADGSLDCGPAPSQNKSDSKRGKGKKGVGHAAGSYTGCTFEKQGLQIEARGSGSIV